MQQVIRVGKKRKNLIFAILSNYICTEIWLKIYFFDVFFLQEDI